MADPGRAVVLLDVDGVLLDNASFDTEWERLGADAFGFLGGDPSSLAGVLDRAWKRVEGEHVRALARTEPSERPPPSIWWDQANADWIEEACRLVGVAAPAVAEDRVAAAERGLSFYFNHTQALIPGAARAIERLAGSFEIHMASGNPAFVVEIVLDRLGVRELVGHPFGSDLLGEYKQHGVDFYRRIGSRIGTGAPLIVVDDLDGPLASAREVGAIAVKVGTDPGEAHHLAIDALEELPGHLDRLVHQLRDRP